MSIVAILRQTSSDLSRAAECYITRELQLDHTARWVRPLKPVRVLPKTPLGSKGQPLKVRFAKPAPAKLTRRDRLAAVANGKGKVDKGTLEEVIGEIARAGRVLAARDAEPEYKRLARAAGLL